MFSHTSVWPRADPGVQAVSPQVTLKSSPSGTLPLLSARPAFTFPAEERHRPLTSTMLYCLVTEANRREHIVQGCYAALSQWEFNSQTWRWLQDQHLTATPHRVIQIVVVVLIQSCGHENVLKRRHNTTWPSKRDAALDSPLFNVDEVADVIDDTVIHTGLDWRLLHQQPLTIINKTS